MSLYRTEFLGQLRADTQAATSEENPYESELALTALRLECGWQRNGENAPHLEHLQRIKQNQLETAMGKRELVNSFLNQTQKFLRDPPGSLLEMKVY